MISLSFRRLCLLGLAMCAFGLAFALYLQHVQGLEPCPMCIFQRIAMLACGLIFAAGAIHAPTRGGRWAYAILAAVAAVIGAVVAGRHVWLQGLPPDQVPACGPTLDYLLGLLPVMEVVTMVLRGDGNCAKIDAAFLGLSLPAWTLVAFVVLALLALLSPWLSRQHRLGHSLS